MKQYLSVSDVAQLLSMTDEWVYRKSKELDIAKIRLAGKVLRPIRFDKDVIESLFTTGSSLTTYRNQKNQSRNLRNGDKRLWG